MYKENGRFEPAEEKEMANIRLKKMTCNTCGTSAHFSRVQFGEKKKCTASTGCDGIMEEDIDI